MSQDHDAARHQLSAEENRRIFAADIVPDHLTGPAPQDPATAVFLLGQPGAGKTRVAQLIAEQLDARGGFADVDSDLYKPYHPMYARLMAEDDRLMTLYTGNDGRAWMRQAQQFVRGEDPLSGGQKINALVQEIAMDPRFLAETMRKYRAVGTRVDTFVLAVPQALSEQGILNRYHEQVLDRGQGRLTVPEKARASYTGIVDSCEVVAREGLADFAAVYRRGDSHPRFAADAAELAREPLALRQAVERERNRLWTPEESHDFLTVQRKLREGLLADFGPQLDRIDRLAAPLLTAPGPGTSRISAAAARSRSTTTVRKPDGPERGSVQDPGSRQQPHHRRPDGPGTGRGRTR